MGGWVGGTGWSGGRNTAVPCSAACGRCSGRACKVGEPVLLALCACVYVCVPVCGMVPAGWLKARAAQQHAGGGEELLLLAAHTPKRT